VLGIEELTEWHGYVVHRAAGGAGHHDVVFRPGGWSVGEQCGARPVDGHDDADRFARIRGQVARAGAVRRLPG
jgi:hypothetical protein